MKKANWIKLRSSIIKKTQYLRVKLKQLFFLWEREKKGEEKKIIEAQQLHILWHNLDRQEARSEMLLKRLGKPMFRSRVAPHVSPKLGRCFLKASVWVTHVSLFVLTIYPYFHFRFNFNFGLLTINCSKLANFCSICKTELQPSLKIFPRHCKNSNSRQPKKIKSQIKKNKCEWIIS